MNWEAVGAIAEAIGVIAIFLSLIYVAVQIRQNSLQLSRSVEATELAAFERNIDSGNHVREILILNADVSKLFLQGLKSYRQLEQLDKFRFGLLLRNIFSETQGVYVRHISMRKALHEFESSAQIIDELLSHKGVREWLEVAAPDWRPGFREFVEQRLALITASTTPPAENQSR